jgi:hypothetical protein
VTYYLAERDEDDFLGVPLPAVGVRVTFDVEKLFAARERLPYAIPVDRTLTGDEGLLVHEDPMAVLQLPLRLWRVDELDGVVRPAPAGRWLRCRSLTVQEQLPRWLVMGPYGAAVERVIDQACGLTDELVHALAALDPADEQELTSVVWQRFLAVRRSGSPVGCGLSTVHGCVAEAARRTDPHLFGWDEADGVEVLTDPAWQEASRAANAAALGLGARDLVSPQESERLARRWTSVFGMPGPRDLSDGSSGGGGT